MIYVLLCSLTVLLCSCSAKASNLEDITEEVISKDRGVIVDIEPGTKK
jgi:hypothetical protein